MANSSALPFPIPSGAGDVVPLDGGIRDCGDSCTKSEGLELRKGPKTWCKRNERTRFCGSLCTKSEAAERRTTNRRSLRLHRLSWDAHREGGALARDAVHVNRCVMDHQRVFYDGEA